MDKARKDAAVWRAANLERARENCAKWRAANQERANEAAKAWHKAHPDKRRKHRADWRAAHAEQVKESKRQWNQANPSRGVAYASRRRAQKAANGGSFTAPEWEALKSKYDHCCLCCGRAEPEIKLYADHVVPIVAGGSSDISNIQPLCQSCNLSKHTKSTDYRP